jgi:hypothetical protein
MVEQLEPRIAPTIDIHYTWLTDHNFSDPNVGARLTLQTADVSGTPHIQLVDSDNNNTVIQDQVLNDNVTVEVTGGPADDKLNIDFSTATTAAAFTFMVNFSDGPDNSLKQDSVTIAGTGGYHPQSFTLTSNADVKVLGQLTTVGDIHITDAATPNVTVDNVLDALGLPQHVVETSEANITVGTGQVGDTTSLQGNNVDLEATSTITASDPNGITLPGNFAQVAPIVATSTAHVNVVCPTRPLPLLPSESLAEFASS